MHLIPDIAHDSVTLSKTGIIRHFEQGNIIISPCKYENLKEDPHLKTVSYDVTLGHHFFREKKPTIPNPLRNPYDKKSVLDSWEICEAVPWGTIASKYYGKIEDSNIPEDRNVIILEPGEEILGHTNEFIGGRKIVTTSMHARSSAGRNLILVCKCAGLGDIDYVNRWTQEISNVSRYYPVVLIEGEAYAQIAFSEVELTDDTYVGSKYQSTNNLEKLIAEWKPQDMLPKKWLDLEKK